MNIQNIRAYVEYNPQNIKRHQVVVDLITLLLLSIPCIIWLYNIWVAIGFILFDLFIIAVSIYIVTRPKTTTKHTNLFYGLYLLFISVSCISLSFKFLVIAGYGYVYLLCGMIFAFFVAILLTFVYVLSNIRRGKYKEYLKNKMNRVGYYSLAGAAIGITVTRMVANQLSQSAIFVFLSILLFALALLCCLGTAFFLKLHFQIKYKL